MQESFGVPNARNDARRRFRKSTWPIDVDDVIKDMPFLELGLSKGLQNSISRAFSGNQNCPPSTVGELLEISPGMLIIRARPRSIGEGGVKELLAALAAHGIVPRYPRR